MMRASCCERMTIWKIVVGLDLQGFVVFSQNCIVPRPSDPTEYAPVNDIGFVVNMVGFTSSRPPVKFPLPSATKLPARAKEPFVAVSFPLVENA